MDQKNIGQVSGVNDRERQDFSGLNSLGVEQQVREQQMIDPFEFFFGGAGTGWGRTDVFRWSWGRTDANWDDTR